MINIGNLNNKKKSELGFINSKVPLAIDVSDIVIGEEVSFDHYIDNEVKYNSKIVRRYNDEHKKSKIIVSIKMQDAPKYVLQDIAFEYGKEINKPVLLLIGSELEVELTTIEKQLLRDEGLPVPKFKIIFRLFFINAKEPFNHHLYGFIDIPMKEHGEELKITDEISFKISSLLNHFSFYVDTIHIISPKSDFDYTLNFIKNYKSFIQDIVFLDTPTIIKIFDRSKPFEIGSKSKKIFFIGMAVTIIVAIFTSNYLSNYNKSKEEENLSLLNSKKRELSQANSKYSDEMERNKKIKSTIDENKIFMNEKDIR